jgi:hypothetical protein
MKRKYLICLALLTILGVNQLPKTFSQSLPSTFLRLPEVEPQLRNNWTPELEAEFQKRATWVISQYGNKPVYGNKFGENEKRAYPLAMFDFLSGNRAKAIAFLEAPDSQAKDHAHTEGIDYYFCFTLKGQIRKYFQFGRYLSPSYRQQMYAGAKKWTERDPLKQPHPIYGYGTGTGVEWSIQRRGLWVDGRNTDNLRAMREVAVYLMAEETQNEATRQIYQARLTRYVWALYNIGMGEWDSNVYHAHTFAAYLNLYDFAKNREVKQLAKAALDWMATAAAFKYYHGSWAGPVKRDYGDGNRALSSGAAGNFWLYFGDTGELKPTPDNDALHFITSAYRPPLAVVELARKRFPKPVEVLSSKPLYENWKPGNADKPGYWETQFFGRSFQMGSLAGTFADGDVAPFKLLAANSERGVDFFIANSGDGNARPSKRPGDEIGQYRHLLVWLRPADQPFFWQLPKSATLELEDSIWFIALEKTWLAIYPINLNSPQIVPWSDPKLAEKHPQEQLLQALTKKELYAGFALEVGEAPTYPSFAAFKEAIRSRGKLDLSNLEQGKLTLQGSTGEELTFIYNQDNLLPQLWRDRQPHIWAENFALYRSLNPEQVPISLGWKVGKLIVKTDNYEFISQPHFGKKYDEN